MTYTPDYLLAQLTYRQQQLRQEADAFRLAQAARSIPRSRERRMRRSASLVASRIRRSLDALTEWPHPV